MSSELDRFLAHARGSAAAAKIVSLDELGASRGESEAHGAPATTWGLATLRGRLGELSARGATATLTAAIEIVAEAQTQGEPVAWIALGNGTFYPPDVADSGVDLAALVVVRAPDAIAGARAAERCLRSGAFGLVILDLGGADLTMPIQGRLVTLAQTHDAAVVVLTDKSSETASLGSLVSLRAEALRGRVSPPAARGQWATSEFEVTVRVLKDKRRGPGQHQTLRRRGPAGLF
jgi:recombination protein RecA